MEVSLTLLDHALSLSIIQIHLFHLQVFSRIDAKLVIILTSVPQCKLQIENNESWNIDTLRQLKSEKFNLKTKIPVLEQPNLIRDLSAQGKRNLDALK